MLVCDETAALLCCARFLRDDIEESLAYSRAIPCSSSRVSDLFLCSELTPDDRCSERAYAFVDGEHPLCKAYDLPPLEDPLPGPIQCKASTDSVDPDGPDDPVDPDNTGRDVPVAAIAGGVAGFVGIVLLTALIVRGSRGGSHEKPSVSNPAGADAVADDDAAKRLHAEEGRRGMLGGADIETPPRTSRKKVMPYSVRHGRIQRLRALAIMESTSTIHSVGADAGSHDAAATRFLADESRSSELSGTDVAMPRVSIERTRGLSVRAGDTQV